MKIEQVNWDRSAKKAKTIIDMVDCSDLLPGGPHEEYGKKFNRVFSLETLLSGRMKSDFLCPLNLDSLNVEGDYEADVF